MRLLQRDIEMIERQRETDRIEIVQGGRLETQVEQQRSARTDQNRKKGF